MIYNKINNKHDVNFIIKKNELKKRLSIKNDNEKISIIVFLRIYKKEKKNYSLFENPAQNKIRIKTNRLEKEQNITGKEQNIIEKEQNIMEKGKKRSEKEQNIMEKEQNIYLTTVEVNEEDIYEDFNIALNQFRQDVGRVNILVTGKTGVGKSTLINSIFHEKFVEVDIGRPITQKIQEYSKPGSPITIIDTKGLEIKDYDVILRDIENYIENRKNNIDESEQLHVAWVCIAENSDRFDHAERALIELLIRYRIPVIVVITKALFNRGLEKIIKEYCPLIKGIIRVRAEKFVFEEGVELPSLNLSKLVELTNDVLDEGMKNAFIASQKVQWELKFEIAFNTIENSKKRIQKKMYIPFNQSRCIINELVRMITEISSLYGLELERESIISIVKTIYDGKNKNARYITLNILKFIPIVNIKAKRITGNEAAESIEQIGILYLKAVINAYKNTNYDSLTKNDLLISLDSILREYI